MAAVECAFNVGNGIVSVASIIASGVIGYLSARRISNRNARAAAVAKLRAAFAPAQVKLSLPKSIGNVEVREYFDNAFLLHAAAIEEFSPFACDSVAYQKAFDDYRKALYDNDALGDARLRWDSGMMVDVQGENALDFLVVISDRIKAILNQA